MIVHRYWTGDGTPPLGRWGRRAVQTVEPGARLHDWTDATLPPWARLGHPAPWARSNYARFMLLARLGGLWLDHDVIPLRALTAVHAGPWLAGLRGSPEASVAWFPETGHPLAVAAAQAVADQPAETVAAHLAVLIGQHRDVTIEPRVLPHDSTGGRTDRSEVWAVHLWTSSRGRHERTRR